MRKAALLLMLSFGHAAFATVTLESLTAPVRGSSSQFHNNVLTLINLTGLREELLSNQHTMAEQGKREILRRFPKYNPAFAEEWARRMEDRISVDEYVNVVVAVYERNYTNEDILEMIRIQRDLRAAKTPVPSPRLQAKLSKLAVTVQSEIVGGFTELGAKRGGEIGQKVAKEHPGWLTRSDGPDFDVTPAN